MPSPYLPSPTVFVVDDDEQMCDSLAALLDVLGYAVRTFPSGFAFERYYCPDMPGCLVLDIRMPRQSGLELYEKLLLEGKRLPVIFITAHADVSTAVAAMKTGAIEFLEKPFDRQMLLDRVRRAMALDAEWRSRDSQLAEVTDRMARLTERERETLDMILAGASNKVMAAQLFVGERAVEMRRAAIMRKLEVRNLAELFDLTITHRILADVQLAVDPRQIPLS